VKRAILLLALLGVSSQAAAQQQPPQTMPINYVDADLAYVIRSLAMALGVNVMLTDVPPKRITFQTPQPIPVAEVGAVLEAILESEGLVIVQTGPVAQVMPEEKKPATGPVRVGKDFPIPPPLGLVTQIVPLEYIQAEEGVLLLRQVAGKSARIEVVPRSNAVLITDRGVSIARYVELLARLDVKTGGEAGLRTYVYPLKHASAPELAATLGQLFGAALSGGAAGRQRVQALAGQSLTDELRSMRQRELTSFQQPGLPPPTAAPPPRSAADTVQAEIRGLVGRTSIVPDQATNSLVIRTAPPNFALLQETIQQLDVRPPQVLLEVLIVEVTLDRSSQWGINWQVLTSGDSTRRATIGFGPQNFGDTLVGNLQGLGVRIIRLASMDVRAIIQAVAAKTNVRVLSTPRILALNNEQARILVGSAVPFTSSTLTGLNALVNQVVQFRNVGTQLTVIPTVNNDGYVTFRLLQEVSALSAQTIASAQNAPVITTREAETSAIVKTGHTVVIGGLIGESEEVTESGVPLLKDIPVLGYLFKSRRVARARTEIAIFLTPSVVYTDEEADSLLQVQRRQLRESKGKIDSLLRPKTDSLLRPKTDSLLRPKLESLLPPARPGRHVKMAAMRSPDPDQATRNPCGCRQSQPPMVRPRSARTPAARSIPSVAGTW
jgi:general secretion pathway protein D